MPTAVLLDLDDTLLANRAAEREMLEQLGDEIVAELPAFDRAQLVPRFLQLREPQFRRVLDGETDVPGYRAAHFREVVAPWGEPSDALVARSNALRDGVHTRSRLAPGARELLTGLRERGHRLGLLTNGTTAMQRGKLRRLGLEEAFDALGITEELGAAKPDPAAFHAVLARLDVAPSDAVMVGDNLVNDIAGALDAGLAGAIWTRVDPSDPGQPPPGVPVVDGLEHVLATLDSRDTITAWPSPRTSRSRSSSSSTGGR